MISDISYTSLIGAKLLCIKFYKIDRFIWVYDGARHWTLYGFEKYDFFWNRSLKVIGAKHGTTYVFPHYYMKFKVDLYDSLLIEKTLKMHVIIHIKSVLNKDQNHYYYNIFLVKCSCQLSKK